MVLDAENMDKGTHCHSVQSSFYNKEESKLTLLLTAGTLTLGISLEKNTGLHMERAASRRCDSVTEDLVQHGVMACQCK